MVVPIVSYGNEVLHKETTPIDDNYSKEQLEELIQNLKDTVVHSGGVGIAAPQINESVSVFIAKDLLNVNHFQNDNPKLWKVYINPEIVEEAKNLLPFPEGCLSLPGLEVNVNRPSWVSVKYLDENLDEKEETLEGFQARVFQHEYDHLKGIVSVDHLKKSKRKALKESLNNIETGNIEVRYEMIFNKKDK